MLLAREYRFVPLWRILNQQQQQHLLLEHLGAPLVVMPNNTEKPNPNLILAILRNDSALVEELLPLSETPSAVHLNSAMRGGNLEIVRMLVDAGCDFKTPDTDGRTLLSKAVAADQLDIARELLTRGADPNVDRPLISAVNARKSPDRQIAFVQLLIEHGAEVNRLYSLYGDEGAQFTVLDWAEDPEVQDHLRQHAANSAKELLGKEKGFSRKTSSDEAAVVSFFSESFGPVSDRAILEIVPDGEQIPIRYTKSDSDDSRILFTVGLSSNAMPVPDTLKDYAHAELFVELPASWDLTDPSSQWPIEWMRRIARYPRASNTHFDGPVIIVANGKPPKPLSRGIAFTGVMLFAEKSFLRAGDGETVQLYRLVPVFSEERQFKIEHGAAALIREFDRQSVPFVVDIHRNCISTS